MDSSSGQVMTLGPYLTIKVKEATGSQGIQKKWKAMLNKPSKKSI